MKLTFFIVIGLLVIFFGIHVVWRNIQKRKREAELAIEHEDPKFIELENEKKEIRKKRAELELEHPYQKIVSYKIKYETAREANDKEAMEKYSDAIERIRHEYNADDAVLAKAFRAQMDAMSRRLAQIEIEQRLIKVKAKKIV